MNAPSVEPILRSRLLPRISFRSLFIVTTAGAVFFAVAQSAGQGAAFASAIVVTLVFLAASFTLFALSFFFAWALATLWANRGEEPASASPFAEGQLPPQLIRPRESQP